MGRAGHGGRSRTRSRKGGVERRGRGRCRGRGGPGLSGARECSRTGETVGGLLRQVRGTRRVSGLDVSARSSWGGLWCGWGSWGEPGRGRVRICCKGVSRRDRPRAEARNINVSLPELRLGPGLCNRFGQTAPPRAPARTAAAALAPTPGPTRPDPRAPRRALRAPAGASDRPCRERHAHLDEHGTDPLPPLRTAPPAPRRPPPCRERPPRTPAHPPLPAPSHRSPAPHRPLQREMLTESFSPGRPPGLARIGVMARKSPGRSEVCGSCARHPRPAPILPAPSRRSWSLSHRFW